MTSRIQLSITSFNLLAPVYFRLGNNGILESSMLHSWTNRNRALARYLKLLGSDIICLQELWIDSQTAMDLLRSELADYSFITQRRYNGKPDGIAIGFKRSRLCLEHQENFPLGTVADRVALFAHLSSKENPDASIVVGNTHFTFPHTLFDFSLRTSQALNVVSACKSFSIPLPEDVPTLIGGDFNGIAPVTQSSPETQLQNEWWDILHRKGGFNSAFFVANNRHPKISHVNHRHELVGVDHIFAKGNMTVKNCHLEPSCIDDSVSIERPLVSERLDHCDKIGGVTSMSHEKFSRFWRTLSDHRPITAVIEIGN